MQAVTPRPSFYVHLGTDGPPGLPEFSTFDGKVLVPLRVVPLDATSGLLRVDLGLETGAFRVRYPGLRDPSAVFDIAHDLVPTTRSVELRCLDYCVRHIDSDAVAFRIERADGDSKIVLNDAYVFTEDERDALRLVALYGDRREETIFEYPAPRPHTSAKQRSTNTSRSKDSPIPWLLLAIALGLLSLSPRSSTLEPVR